MFCNVCGTELQPTFNLCPKCGKPVGAMANPGSPVALQPPSETPADARHPLDCSRSALPASIARDTVRGERRALRDRRQRGWQDARAGCHVGAGRKPVAGRGRRDTRGLGPAEPRALGAHDCRCARDRRPVSPSVRHRAGHLYALGIVGRWRGSGISATGGHDAAYSVDRVLGYALLNEERLKCSRANRLTMTAAQDSVDTYSQ